MLILLSTAASLLPPGRHVQLRDFLIRRTIPWRRDGSSPFARGCRRRRHVSWGLLAAGKAAGGGEGADPSQQRGLRKQCDDENDG